MPLPFDKSVITAKDDVISSDCAYPLVHEPIVLAEHAFSEFLTEISEEPEKPSEKLLAAVVIYKRHEYVDRNPPSYGYHKSLIKEG